MKTYIIELPWASDHFIVDAPDVDKAFDIFYKFLLNKKYLSFDVQLVSKHAFNNAKSLIVIIENCCGKQQLFVHECVKLV